jgi:hypothetical protein
VGKLISTAVAGVIGAALAATAVWGVVSAATAAPDKNPAETVEVIPYGNR